MRILYLGGQETLPHCWFPCEGRLYFFLSNYSKTWSYCIKFVKSLPKRNKNQKFKKKRRWINSIYRGGWWSWAIWNTKDSHCLCSIPPIRYMIWTTFKDKSRIVSIPVTNFGSQLTALFVNVRMQNSFQERKKWNFKSTKKYRTNAPMKNAATSLPKYPRTEALC